MCNNILQYAHVYAWAREHHRESVSMRFAYKYPYFRICHTKHHNFLYYLIGKYGARMALLHTVSFGEDCDAAALERQMESHRHLMVEGWYVRFYDLFIKYKDEICHLFAFHDNIEQSVERLMAPCKYRLNVGIHVRRGDYARWQGGKYLYSDAQFIAVARQFEALHPHREMCFWICGNDPQLNQEAYRKELGADNVRFPEGNPGEDLCLLSHCDYLIGAPSTFTLVASMYHDVPLYWMMDAQETLTEKSFNYFNYLFKHII